MRREQRRAVQLHFTRKTNTFLADALQLACGILSYFLRCVNDLINSPCAHDRHTYPHLRLGADVAMSESDKLTLARVAWMQSIVSHRIVPERFAKHLYARCCAVAQTAYEESTYRAMMQESSKHLSVLDLELRTVSDQATGQAVLALVNTKQDTLIQGATRYSPLEISLVKKLVEEIFKARRDAYAIPAMEAVRLGSKLRTHLTRDATEELLRNLVDHKWLDYSS